MNCQNDRCSLPTAQLEKRQRSLQRELQSARTRFSRDGHRRFTFDFEPERQARLAALVRAERECCPFLQIDFRTAEDEIGVTIDGPETTLALLDAPGGSHGWAGLSVAGLIGVATCGLPVAAGAAAVWIEGVGWGLLAVGIFGFLWAFWRRPRRC